MHIGQTLAAAAAIGILSGCGGDPPQPATAPTVDPSAAQGAKASCGGADHTDKGHCGAAPTPSASSSAAPATK